MAVDKRLVLTYAFTNALFIGAGIVTLVISLMWRTDALNSPSICFSLLLESDYSHWFGSTKRHLHDDPECRRNGGRNHHDRGGSAGYPTYHPRSCSNLTFSSHYADFTRLVVYTWLGCHGGLCCSPHPRPQNMVHHPQRTNKHPQRVDDNQLQHP